MQSITTATSRTMLAANDSDRHGDAIKPCIHLVAFVFVFISMLLLSPLLISSSLFHNAFTASPAFDQVMITDVPMSNQKNDWVQIYGNDSTRLRSDYANILAIDYDSDGKTLDATFWLASKDIMELITTFI
jgi:uncharacterized protein (DUF2147 family)